MESLVGVVAGGAAAAGCRPLAIHSVPTVRMCQRVRMVARASAGGGDGDAPRGLPELDEWEKMELKFGRLIGEDPKLTLAKVMAKKANPDLSSLEVEKLITKKKYKLEDFIAMAQEVSVERATSKPTKKDYESKNENQKEPVTANLNLMRPVIGKAAPVTTNLNLMRPVIGKAAPVSAPNIRDVSVQSEAPSVRSSTSTNSSMSDVALRKPTLFLGVDDKLEKKLTAKPVIHVKMREDMDNDLSTVTLLKRPSVMQMPSNVDSTDSSSDSSTNTDSDRVEGSEVLDSRAGNRENASIGNVTRVGEYTGSFQEDIPKVSTSRTSTHKNINCVREESIDDSNHALRSLEFSSDIREGLQHSEQHSQGDNELMHSGIKNHSHASLLGKPRRLSLPADRISHHAIDDMVEDENYGDNEAFLSSIEQVIGDDDLERVEHLMRTGKRVEVELISCSGRGFVVSYGSIIGFLPYQNLATKWKFLAFDSWLRKRGLDPSLYRQNSGATGTYEVDSRNHISGDSLQFHEDNQQLPSDPKYDLLQLYEKEKTKFLSSFIGQRIRVSIVMVDRESKKILFSGRRKENEELSEKKRKLMAKLHVGDTVKCCVKKFSYFGIFVEIEEVPALIHQSEVSWDTTLELSSSFKIGQTVDAKVYQLDYAAERIFLSLKNVKSDSFLDSLESIVGDETPLGGSLKVADTEFEWSEVESLITEMQTIEGVTYVSKGRSFFSPGLAPSFQVYMSPMSDNEYKLLVRFENRVQEVIVQASLDRERMKAAVAACTSRVG